MRYDDPALGIDWPAPVEVISEKDAPGRYFGAAEPRMIIVDRALEERRAQRRADPRRDDRRRVHGPRHRDQIVNSVPGMGLAAIANRTRARGARLRGGRVDESRERRVDAGRLRSAIAAGKQAVSPRTRCSSPRRRVSTCSSR